MTEPFSFDVYDYLVLGISIVITLISIWKGLINSILSLLTWIGSILITIYSWNWFSHFLIVDQLNKINLLYARSGTTMLCPCNLQQLFAEYKP